MVNTTFIGYFSLYFGAGERIKVGNPRALMYFLCHLPFMAALIVVLRGVATLLSFVVSILLVVLEHSIKVHNCAELY